jgi:lysozyme
MKKPFSLLVIMFLLGLIGGSAFKGYSSGYWRFNHPSYAEYPIRGLDISHHQGNIDWNALREEHLSFVYIKATEGGTYRDLQFSENWEAANRIGMARGAYHFFTFCRSGKEQAMNFVSTVPVDPHALPPAIDFEFAGNCDDRPNPAVLLKELTDFIRVLERVYHKRPIIYVGRDSYEAYLKGKVPSFKLWVRNVLFTPQLSDRTDWTFWQYAENSHVNGIDGIVDLNVFNGAKPLFAEFSDETIEE